MTNWPLIMTPAKRASLIAHLTELYAQARETYQPCAEHVSEALSGRPSMDMIEPDEFRARMEELIR